MSEENSASVKMSALKIIREEIGERMERVRSGFVLKVIVSCIFIFGGLGVWKEIYWIFFPPESSDWGGMWNGALTASTSTYPVIIALSAIQLMLLQKPERQEIEKIMKIFWFMLFLVISFMIIGVWILESNGIFPIPSIIIVILLSSFSLWIWCIANCYNRELDDFDNTAAVGGELDKPLKGKTEEYTI